MFTTTTGIVLRDSDYKDYDKILTVLTRDFGLQTLKVRGVRKSSSSMKSACQLLAYSEFTYRTVNNFLIVNEAVSLETFSELRNNLECLSLGFYFAQVIELIAQQDIPDNRLLSLLLNCLYALAKTDAGQKKVKSVFELRSICHAGFQPNLSGCAHCGSSNPEFFDVHYGELVCSKCGSLGENGLCLPINPNVLSAMRYIIQAQDKKIMSFRLEKDAIDQLAGITEAFMLSQFEHGFSALSLYKSLFYQMNAQTI